MSELMVEWTPDIGLEHLRTAAADVAENQEELWDYSVGEQAIAGQIFARLYRMAWPDGASVDTEYDRESVDGYFKSANPDASVKPRKNNAGSARPDIVVYRRGKTGRDYNFMVIEFKRADGLSDSKVKADLKKVRKLMSRFDYQVGAAVALGLTKPAVKALWLTDPQGEPQSISIWP
jgi:hypothetical protein